jgi:hypothetical protein
VTSVRPPAGAQRGREPTDASRRRFRSRVAIAALVLLGVAGVGVAEPPTPDREGDALALYDFVDRRVRRLATLPFRLARFKTPRLAVSRDGRWVLANHLDAWERDVMVADNFR